MRERKERAVAGTKLRVTLLPGQRPPAGVPESELHTPFCLRGIPWCKKIVEDDFELCVARCRGKIRSLQEFLLQHFFN